jgi:RHS repeat-associated protein
LALYEGSQTYFNHVNALGSTSMFTNQTGGAQEDMLFYPWGDVWKSQGTGGYNFAYLPYRDLSTTTDITTARFISPNFGRWLSPDPGPWILLNPQSYNAYAYALNNPVRYSDDGGETAQDRVNAAYAFAAQGISYVFGGKEPGCGLDCSGLVQNVFKADPDNLITALDTVLRAEGQASVLQQGGYYSTDINNAEAGDAIFFSDSNGNIVHTGIVVDVKDGRVYFVHAPRVPFKVRVGWVSIKSKVFGAQKVAGVGRPFEPTNRTSPNATQNYNASSGGLWNWFENLFFNWTPPPPPPPEPYVTSRICAFYDETGCH